jgi:hypothetical protein
VAMAHSHWEQGGYVNGIKPSTVPEAAAMWGLDSNGAPWFCNHSDTDTQSMLMAWSTLPSFSLHASWGRVQGRFVSITSANGVTWGLGEDGSAYALVVKYVPASAPVGLRQRVSSDASLSRQSVNFGRHNTASSMEAEISWVRIPPFRFFDQSGIMPKLVSISLVLGHAWAVTSVGYVIVRSGVCKDSPLGQHWHRVGKETNFVKVFAAPQMVGALNSASTVLFRRGFSAQEPFGTYWVLDNGDIRSCLLPPLPRSDGVWSTAGAAQHRFITVGGAVRTGLCGVTHDGTLKRGAYNNNGIVTWVPDHEMDMKMVG